MTLNTEKHYSTKSNAVRAAKSAGLMGYSCEQDDAGWFIVPLVREPEAAEYEAPGFDEVPPKQIEVAPETETVVEVDEPHVTESSVEEDTLSALRKTADKRKRAAKTAEPRPTTSKRRRDQRDAAPGKPSGMVVEILRLASRKNGVGRAELNEVTGWRNAGWNTVIGNACKRWGYKMEIVQYEGGKHFLAHKL